MQRLNEKSIMEEGVKLLKLMIGRSIDYRDKHLIVKNRQKYQPDLLVKIDGFLFLIEVKSGHQVGAVAEAIRQLGKYKSVVNDEIPLIIVPFMDEAGTLRCKEAGISWLDLSGNADVKAPGLRLYVRGEKNKYTRPGRKENPFSPKSSRIARRLLYRPDERMTQRELTASTGLSEGLVSRVVRELEKQHLVSRDDNNQLFAADRGLLLDAWAQGYDFSKHELVRGHVVGRTGQEVQRKVSMAFNHSALDYAATGSGAAWQYSKFASFRIASFYLSEWPDDATLEATGFREVDKGENVWLLLPKDEDVFFDIEHIDTVPCVHPVQVWLDLKSHPERAEEAAEELRHQIIS